MEDLVRDLRVLRAQGLIRLRRLDLPALEAAARRAGLDPSVRSAPQPVETLLRAAVRSLGDDGPGLAAQYLFGLVQGTVGRSPTELRARAAEVFDRSPETFRKDRERRLVEWVAEEILRLSRPSALSRPSGPGPGLGPAVAVAADPSPEAGSGVDRVRAVLREELQRLLVDDDRVPAGDGRGGPAGVEAAAVVASPRTVGPLLLPAGGATVPVTLHLGAADVLRDVDIMVTSANVYLDPSRTFAATLLGQVRNGASRRDGTGRVVEDVVADELAAWVRSAGGPDRPVQAGVVVPTSPGALSRRGIRRLYHAAVAEPVLGTNNYIVTREGVARAVARCFELASDESERYRPRLSSLCLPLFGAGRVGLDPAVSFGWIWPTVVDQVVADPTLQVHFSLWRTAEAVAVLRLLHRGLDAP